MKYIIGFDLGTSSCKAAIYNEDLTYICGAQQEYATSFFEPSCAQQDPEAWWEAFCGCVKMCLLDSGIAPREIAAVGIDSMGSAVVPVDDKGSPLHPALIWLDRRAQAQCVYMRERLGSRLFEISGNCADPSDMAPKVLWFKDERPDIYERTHKFLHANGYLIHKLTGVFSQDVTENGLSLLCDIRQNEWSEELISALGIDRNKFPDIYGSEQVVGTITRRAAAMCGLAEGTKVIAGAMDNMASALGTSSLTGGDTYIVGGTACSVGIVFDAAEPRQEFHLHNHIIPGKYIAISAVDFGGGGLRWFKNILEGSGYGEIDRMAGHIPAGNNGLLFLPYMVGQRAPLYNSNTTGVMFGLTPEHGKGHLARMFMEGTAYAVKKILGIYKAAGSVPARASLTGGISNSELWSQILCDIIGIEINLPGSADVATLGIAVTAAVGIGIYRDYEQAMRARTVRKQYRPNPANQDVYNKMSKLFEYLYDTIVHVYDYARNDTGKDN